MAIFCFLLNAAVATMYTVMAAADGGTGNVVCASVWWTAAAIWLIASAVA